MCLDLRCFIIIKFRSFFSHRLSNNLSNNLSAANLPYCVESTKRCTRGKLIDKSGHYEAKCQACNRLFSPGNLPQIKKHIIDECTKVSKKIKEAVIYNVESCESNITRTKSSTEQLSLNEFLKRSSIHKFLDESCKQYAIKPFNSRFKEYESNEYLLAYFLHPGYKKTCPTTLPSLQLLGTKIFLITPHAASCKRIWPICGWIPLNIDLDDYDLNEEEGTMWKNIDLLKLFDLENSIFQDTDNQKMKENSVNEDESDLNNFIQDSEDQEDYNP
ncbi:26880_t:CDS:2, partial [Gigaspora margarita]